MAEPDDRTMICTIPVFESIRTIEHSSACKLAQPVRNSEQTSSLFNEEDRDLVISTMTPAMRFSSSITLEIRASLVNSFERE